MELVDSINSTPNGVDDILSEAETVAVGCGSVLKEVWDKDVDDWKRFQKDQGNNGNVLGTVDRYNKAWLLKSYFIYLYSSYTCIALWHTVILLSIHHALCVCECVCVCVYICACVIVRERV